MQKRRIVENEVAEIERRITNRKARLAEPVCRGMIRTIVAGLLREDETALAVRRAWLAELDRKAVAS